MRNFNNILVIRFSSLGDIILASPLIRSLRATYPRAQIDFLTKSQYVDVLKFNPHLSSIIQLQSSTKEELKRLRQQIRKTRYDLIIDIHNSLRSRFLRFFSHARHVRVVNKRAVARFALVNLKRNFYREIQPVADRYLETVKRYDVQDNGGGLEVFVLDETLLSMNALMKKYRLDRFEKVVGLAPTARHFTKRWPSDRFVEFGVQYAQKHRSKFFIFGSQEEHDYCGDIAQLINGRVGSNVAESLAGAFSLLETAAAMDHCHLIVSNDTGIMHLAAARKRKVVALFGSTVRELGFFPYGTEYRVVEIAGLACRPCSHIGLDHCPEGHFRCMKDIQPEQVVTAAEELLV